MRARGKGEEARAAAEEALALHRRRLESNNHPKIADTLQVLAEIDAKLGEHEHAERRFDELIALMRRIYPAGHRKIGAALCNYGTAMFQSGAVSRAEPILREAVTVLCREPIPHLRTFFR